MDLNEIIGKRIKHIRTKKGISQEALAASANIATNYIGQIERGKRNPTISVLENISNVLEVSVQELLNENYKDIYLPLDSSSELSEIIFLLESFSHEQLHNTKLIIEQIAEIANKTSKK